jgi:hypothetical protein
MLPNMNQPNLLPPSDPSIVVESPEIVEKHPHINKLKRKIKGAFSGLK